MCAPRCAWWSTECRTRRGTASISQAPRAGRSTSRCGRKSATEIQALPSESGLEHRGEVAGELLEGGGRLLSHLLDHIGDLCHAAVRLVRLDLDEVLGEPLGPAGAR